MRWDPSAPSATLALLLAPFVVLGSCLKSLDESLMNGKDAGGKDGGGAPGGGMGGTGVTGGTGGSGDGGCDKTLCVGQCVDTLVDPQNCGACGNACNAGQTCELGGCKSGNCPSGQTSCDGTCVDTQTSTTHCGGCNQSCTGAEICSAGQCIVLCDGGLSLCSGTCTDLQADPDHCGGCDASCPSGLSCIDAGCALKCVGGTTACTVDGGPKCVDLGLDPANCGACGTVCSADRTCQGGQCKCVAGTTDCSGTCVDLTTNPQNCGSCGKPCVAPTPTCAGGTCTLVCSGGTVNCNNACVDTQTDAKNCGSCAKACQSGEVCLSGLCCKSGQVICSGACATLSSDPNNCGSCGKTCTAPLPGCAAGTCVAGTRIMFVALNEGHTGSLGGIVGANAMCASQAAAAGMSGTWKAFLSNSTQTVKSLFTAPLSSLPVVNKNGSQMFPSWDNIWVVGSGAWPGTQLIYAFNGTVVDEITAIPPTPTWTDADGWHGSNPAGTTSTATCSDWTDGTATMTGTGGEWDFKWLLYTPETHACNYTAAVGCVSLQP